MTQRRVDVVEGPEPPRRAALRRPPAPARSRPPTRRAARSRRASPRRSPRCRAAAADALSERIASSVTRPPALRTMWASPRSRPSIAKRSRRASMQASTATLRRGFELRPGAASASALAAATASMSSALVISAGDRTKPGRSGAQPASSANPWRQLARRGCHPSSRLAPRAPRARDAEQAAVRWRRWLRLRGRSSARRSAAPPSPAAHRYRVRACPRIRRARQPLSASWDVKPATRSVSRHGPAGSVADRLKLNPLSGLVRMRRAQHGNTPSFATGWRARTG